MTHHSYRLTRLIAVVLGAGSLAACAVVETSTGDIGIAYSLPKGQVQFVAERKIVTADHVNAALKAFAEAAALVTADEMAQKAAQKELADLKGVAENLAAGTPERAQADMKVLTAAAAVAYLEGKVKADTALRDDAKKSADALANSIGTTQEMATIKVLPPVPDSDRSARFVANVQHLITRDDNVKLSLANGMLSNSEMVSTDRTGDILVEIAKIASLFVGAPPVPFRQSMMGVEETPPPEQCKPYHLSMIINPLDKTEFDSLTEALTTAKSAYKIGVSPKPDSPVARPVSANDAKKAENGLFYRAPISVTIRADTTQEVLDNCAFKTTPPQSSVSTMLPDTSQTFVLPMSASIFTTRTQKATFKDGMLASYDTDQPSELLAIASLPIEIARAFMSIPTEFLKLRVDYDNASVAETNAQVEQMKAQLEALKAAQALNAAKAGDAPGAEVFAAP